MLIVVASSSPHKIVATTQAVAKIFGDTTDAILTNVAAADIQTTVAQPVGLIEAIACARERLACAARARFDDDFIVVALENYVARSGATKGLYDGAVVLIGRDEVSFAWALSPIRVHVPDEYCPDTIDGRWKERTVGSRIAEARGDPALATDWFAAVGSNHTRASQLRAGVELALKKHTYHENTRAKLAVYQDFPCAGVAFIDIFSLLASSDGTGEVVSLLAERVRAATDLEDVFVAGLESRGMMLGLALAHELDCPFVPVRKPGKLPPTALERIEYKKEYGTDTFEISRAYAARLPKHAIVVDDLLATGGSMAAACTLIERIAGTKVVLALALLEVKALRPTWQAALKGWKVAVAL